MNEMQRRIAIPYGDNQPGQFWNTELDLGYIRPELGNVIAQPQRPRPLGGLKKEAPADGFIAGVGTPNGPHCTVDACNYIVLVQRPRRRLMSSAG